MCAGVLDVLHCVLIDSPEALNVIKEQHIRTVISLIDKHGRDPKVSSRQTTKRNISSRPNMLPKALTHAQELTQETCTTRYAFLRKFFFWYTFLPSNRTLLYSSQVFTKPYMNLHQNFAQETHASFLCKFLVNVFLVCVRVWKVKNPPLLSLGWFGDVL